MTSARACLIVSAVGTAGSCGAFAAGLLPAGMFAAFLLACSTYAAIGAALKLWSKR